MKEPKSNNRTRNSEQRKILKKARERRNKEKYRIKQEKQIGTYKKTQKTMEKIEDFTLYKKLSNF